MGLKPILRTTTSFSALTLSVGLFDPQEPVPDMTYNVFSGTLNPTQSINHFDAGTLSYHHHHHHCMACPVLDAAVSISMLADSALNDKRLPDQC